MQYALARLLGAQFKSGIGEASLFHGHSTYMRTDWMTYAGNPLQIAGG